MSEADDDLVCLLSDPCLKLLHDALRLEGCVLMRDSVRTYLGLVLLVRGIDWVSSGCGNKVGDLAPVILTVIPSKTRGSLNYLKSRVV